MHNLMINTAWTKPQFARASSDIARRISRSQMGLRDDPKKLKSGDIALIKTAAISASVAEGLRRRSNSTSSSTESKTADDSSSSININCSNKDHTQVLNINIYSFTSTPIYSFICDKYVAVHM